VNHTNEQPILKRAAVVIVRNSHGLILAVSRKTDATLFCLPGGKLDPGEDAPTAAKRELLEETGVVLISARWIFAENDGEYFTDCFVADSWQGLPTSLEQGVNVDWLTVSEICASRSAYPEYNTRAFEALRSLDG